MFKVFNKKIALFKKGILFQIYQESSSFKYFQDH